MGTAHFEIHVADSARARAFYGGLFGWSFDPMPGGEDMEYHLITGAGISPDAALSGGMMKRIGAAPTPGSPIRGATLTFEIKDVDASYAWALENGGAEALPPADYPGIGRCAYVDDGEGNVVGFITPEASD